MAEADIHAPFRQEFDESTEMAGKPIPGFLCRVLVPEKTLLGTIHILRKHLKWGGRGKNGNFSLFSFHPALHKTHLLSPKILCS